MPSSNIRKRVDRRSSPGLWPLQDAKARFSEVVRLAQTEGPQHITVHGKQAVVMLSEAEFQHLKGAHTGQALVDLLAKSPLRDVEIEHASVKGAVRDVEL